MSDRKMLISANWKMNLTHLEAIQWLQKFHYALPKDAATLADISIHPPFTAIRSVQTVIDSDKLAFALGAQNAHEQASGAFTGDVSAPMLAKLGCQYVIIGHSERRAHAGETDQIVNAKLRAVIAAEMTPILCVGETLAEREEGIAVDKVERQITAALAGISQEAIGAMVIAYEPIWAIGTGKIAELDDYQSMAKSMRSAVAVHAGDEAAQTVRIQFGGSAKVTNVGEIVALDDIDGALVGGASLDPEEFARLVTAAIL
jgi:triosephosphate isomerase